MTSIPLLIQYLPQEGFAWWSKFWTRFLPSSQARRITRALRRAGQPLDKDVVLRFFDELFSKACDFIDRCKDLQPVQFWRLVGSELPWACYLSGSDLLDFSNRILCARIRYLDGWHFYHERIRTQIPHSHRERDYNTANTAIDRWRSLVENTYEDYFPWWLTDSDNEGSLEAMVIRFEAINEEEEDNDVEMRDEDKDSNDSSDI
ncbi:hypothetical protein F5Y06DRAFT_295851 [Hypoxylon sp. FL0890]|nr:hypothetical protein F5Y06DRAFT_295851 [Hypoxylon sp. FL0890]